MKSIRKKTRKRIQKISSVPTTIMPPSDYLHARQNAQNNSEDDTICQVIDGSPYFPNSFVKSPPEVSVEERDNAIKRAVELLILQTCPVQTEEAKSISLDSSSWKVRSVIGGNTNQLFCVSGMEESIQGSGLKLEWKFPDSLLVRLFGAEGMIDRDDETSTYSSLANQGLSLKYYGRFGNGRIEEMLVGWTTLTEDDLMGREAPLSTIQKGPPPTNLNDAIARELARLHATFEIPSNLLVESKNENGETILSMPVPTLWTQLYPWLERALEAKFLTEHDTQRANHELYPPLGTLKEEIDWLKSSVIGGDGDDASATSAGIGFCHNDLLASNIMMLTKSQDPCESDEKQPLLLEGLRFVDFEYGGINYYAYDIANHFNEYAGGTAAEDNSTPDYGRCPSDQEQKAFLKAYVDEYNASKTDQSNARPITAEELATLVDGFSLANHLVWGLWGVLQAATEGCEDGLDYMHYAKCRFDRYTHDKREKYGIGN